MATTTQESEEQRLMAEQRRRDELIYLHEQAKVARQQSKDRALSLLAREDVNLDGMLFAKPTTDFGTMIATATALGGAAGPCPPEDGGGTPYLGIFAPDDSGYVPHGREGAGYDGPGGGPGVINPFKPIGKKNQGACPVKPGKKKKKIDAVDDFGATIHDTRVTIGVLGNDTYEGNVKLVALVGPRNGAIRKVGGAFEYTPRARWTGNDSFKYRITDEDGNSDTATVKVKVTSTPPPGPSCLQMVQKLGLDPLAAATKLNTDRIVNNVYNQAASDLLPGDPIDAQIVEAEREMADAIGGGRDPEIPLPGALPAKGRESFELATAKRQEAVSAKRQIVDALVSHPVDEFANLVAAQAQYPEKVPVHPLLTERDGAAAMRIYKVAKDPALRKEIEGLGRELVKATDLAALPTKIAARADSLYQQLSAPKMVKSVAAAAPAAPARQIAPDRIVTAKPGPRASIKSVDGGFPIRIENARGEVRESIRVPASLTGDPRYLNADLVDTRTGVLRAAPQPLPDAPVFFQDRVEARYFIKRMAEALPVLDQLDRQRQGMKDVLPDDRLDMAEAQVFMVQVAGKERIAAQRQLDQPGVGRVVGIGVGGGGAVKQVALSKDLRLIEEQPLKPFESGKVLAYRQQIALSKEAQSSAQIGMLKSRFLPNIERLNAKASIAEAGLQDAVAEQPDREVRVAAATLPATKEVLDDLRSRVLAVTKTKGASSQEFTKLQQPLKELTQRYQGERAVVERVAAKQPPVKQALRDFDSASEARYAEAVRIKTDDVYQKSLARREQILKPQYAQELQMSAVRAGALPKSLASAPQARSAAGVTRTPVTEATRRNFERMGRSGEIAGARVVPGGGSIYGGSAAAGGGVKSQYGGVTNVANWKPPQAAATGGGAVGGVISRDQLNDPNYVKNLLQQRLGGTLASVHTKEDLQNPDYLEKLLRNRIGNFGQVHRFNNEDDYRDFVQSRLGQFGIAHKKSDLEDPEYFKKQFQARVGGFGYVHQFKDEDELQKFAQSRLGQFGIAHKRSDLENPDYYYKLLKERLGPFVNVYKFDSLDDYKKFVQSRLGGLGRAVTCLDMLEQGMSPEKINAIYDQAKQFGKRDFESQADYEARMLNEHPEEFKQLGNGKVVRKTEAEKKAEREQKLLESGDWIRGPTGTLLRKGSKAAAQVVNHLFDQTRKISVTLDDGTKATLEVSGRASFQDQFEAALKAKGFTRDKNGDWRDKDGRFVMSGESIDELDKKYTNYIDQQAPGYSSFITRKPRPPVAAERPAPPSPSDQLAQLQNRVVNSVGYTVTNLKLGDKTIKSLEVRPGETVSQAIARASGGAYRLDEYGNVVDAGSGDKVLPWWEAEKLDQKYKDKVLASVFGDKFKGIAAEFEALANSSDPKQRLRAQQIIASMEALRGGIDQAVEDQRLAQDRIDAIKASDLSARDKRRQLQQVQTDLDAATKRRKDLETTLFKQAQTANDSAKTAFESSLNYNEQQLLKANRKINDLTAEYQSLDDSLDQPMSDSDRRRRQKRMEEIRKQVFELSKESKDRLSRVDRGLPSPLLQTPDTGKTFNFANNAVIDAKEARDNAVYVRIDDKTGKAYYLDAKNEVIRDLNGNPIEISRAEALEFRDRVRRRLVRDGASFGRTVGRYNGYLKDMEKLKEQIDKINADEIAARAEGRELTSGQRGRRAALANRYNSIYRTAQRLEPDIQRYSQPLALIQQDETEAAEFKKLREEDFKRKQESYISFIKGERHITYTDPETGETKTWKSEKQLAYEAAVAAEQKRQDELRRQQEETARRKAEAERIQAEQKRLREEQARRQAQEETARRERESRQNRLNAAFDREDQRLTTLVGEKAAADREFAAATAAVEDLHRRQEQNPGDRSLAAQTKTVQDRLDRAIRDRNLAAERLQRQQEKQRLAGAAAGVNDDGLVTRVEQQRTKVETLEGQVKDTTTSLEGIQKLRQQFEGQNDPVSRSLAAAYRGQEQALLAAAQTLAGQHYLEKQALDLVQDQALYANASPEFNQRRLDQLQQRVNAGGGNPYSALTETERKEYERRQALATYHNDVKAAFDKLKDLTAIAKQFHDDPNSLTIDQQIKLDRNLSGAERNLIAGELQRQGLLANLKNSDNLIQATAQNAVIEDWMTSRDGARGGTRPLIGSTGGSDLDRVFDFVSGRDTYKAQVDSARAEVQQLEKELRAAEAARAKVDDIKDPWYKVESSITQVHLTRQLLANARDRLREKESDLDKVVGTSSLNSDAISLEWELERARSAGDKTKIAKLESQLTAKRIELERTRSSMPSVTSTNGGFFELRVAQAQQAEAQAREGQAFFDRLKAADAKVQGLVQARIGQEAGLRAAGVDPTATTAAFKQLEAKARQEFAALQGQLVTAKQIEDKEKDVRRLRSDFVYGVSSSDSGLQGQLNAAERELEALKMRRTAQQQASRWLDQTQAQRRIDASQAQVNARINELNENLGVHQARLDEYARRLRVLEAQKKHYEDGKKEGRFEADWADEQIKKLQPEIAGAQQAYSTQNAFVRRRRGEVNTEIESLRDEHQRLLVRDNPAYRQQQEGERFQQMVELQRQLQNYQTQRASRVSDIEARANRLRTQIANASDKDRKKQLEEQLTSVTLALDEQQTMLNRLVRNTERDIYDAYRKNSRDGVGPRGSYELDKLAEARGVSLASQLLIGTDVIDRSVKTGRTTTYSALRMGLGNEPPPAAVFAQGVWEQWNKLVRDPTFLAKTVAYTYYGTGKTVVTGALDLAEIVGEATGLDSNTDKLDALVQLPEFISKLNYNTVTKLIDHGLRQMQKGDMDANAAMFGGAVASLLLPAPSGSGLAAGLGHVATDFTRLERVAAFTARVSEKLSGAGRLTERLERGTEWLGNMARRSAEAGQSLERALQRADKILIGKIPQPVVNLARGTANLARAGFEKLPTPIQAASRWTFKTFIYDADNISAEAFNTLSRANAGLKYADDLERAGNAAIGSKAADLLSEAAAVRREVADKVIGSPEALRFLDRQLGKGAASPWSETGVAKLFKAPEPPVAPVAPTPVGPVASLPAGAPEFPSAAARAPPRPLPVVRAEPGAAAAPRPGVAGHAPELPAGRAGAAPPVPERPLPVVRAQPGPAAPAPRPGAAGPELAAPAPPPGPVPQPPVLRSTPIEDAAIPAVVKPGADPFPPRVASAAAPAGGVPPGVPPAVRGPVRPVTAGAGGVPPGVPPVVRPSGGSAAHLADEVGTDIFRAGRREPAPLTATATGKKTARVTDVKNADGVRTYEITTSDGTTRRIAFDEKNLGKQGFTSQVHVNANNKGEVIRFTNLREDKVGHALDEAGRDVFAGKLGPKPDSDVVDVAARGDAFLVVDDTGRPLYHMEVVQKAENIADKLDPAELTAGQRIAIDRAHRELNSKGYVWLDNKRDNYSLVRVGNGDDWKVVIVDPGGVVPVKSVERGGKVLSEAEVARDIQRMVNISPEELKFVGKGHWDAVASGFRDEVLEAFGDAFDVGKIKNFDGRPLVSPASIHFNPRGHFDMPEQARLFALSDEEAVKAYDALKAGKKFDTAAAAPPSRPPGSPPPPATPPGATLPPGGPGGTQRLSQAELEAAGALGGPGGTQRLSRAELEAAGALGGPGGTQRLSRAELEAAGVARASSPEPFAARPGAADEAAKAARANVAKAAEVRSRVPGDVVDAESVARAQDRLADLRRGAKGAAEEKDAVRFAEQQLKDAKQRAGDLTRARQTFDDALKKHKAGKLKDADFEDAARTLSITERAIEDAEIRAARDLVDHLHDRRFLGRADDAELSRATRQLEKLEARADTRRALKDLEADLKLRAEILDEAVEAKTPLSQADLDWLSGKRRTLTPEEHAWADDMLRSTGDWGALTEKIGKPGGPTKLEMHKIVAHRRQVVDDMLDDVMRRVQAETGQPLRRKAFGSTNLNSDYDLSIDGAGAERVVAEFNDLYRLRYGDEAGIIFDTNVYTDPVYNLFKRKDLKGLDLGPGQDDTFRQFLFSQVATRKYFTDGQWARHVANLKNSVKGNRDLGHVVETALARAESIEKGMKGRLAGRVERLQAEAAAKGLKPSAKSLQMRAQNELYAESLARIDSLRDEVDTLGKLGPGHLDLVPSRSTLQRDVPRLGDAVKDIKRLYREGKVAEADALKAKWQQELAHELRDNQGKALYFASEAYQAQGTIEHVVAEIQAGGKKIDFDLLSSRPRQKIPDDVRAGYLNSFDENRANMFKELNAVRAKGVPNPEKEATKVAKYFIRQLDAAREAGIDLKKSLPDFERLAKATINGDATRANKAKMLAALRAAGYDDPAAFVKAAEHGSDILAQRGLDVSPLRGLGPKFREARAEVDKLLADPRFSDIDIAAEAAANEAKRVAGAAGRPPGSPPGSPPRAPAAGGPNGPGGTQILSRAELEAAGVFNGPRGTQRLTRAELEAAGAARPAPATPDPDELFRRVALEAELEAVAPPAAVAPARVPDNPIKSAEKLPPASAAARAEPPAGHPLDLAPPERLSRPPQTATRDVGKLDVDDPELGKTWLAPDGKSYGIGERKIGEGKTADVYAITDGEFKGDVLKAYKDPPPPPEPYMPRFTASDVVEDVLHGADVLDKNGILTLKTKRGVTGAGRPYVVQERLHPGDVILGEKDKLLPGQQQAVAELFDEMARKGIVWEDGHINNLFFRQVDGKWRAGVLDSDRIFEWGQVPSARMANILETVRTVGFPGVLKKVGNMKSLAGKPQFWSPGSAQEFMGKMLEYNGWIEFDGKAFQARRLDPGVVEGRFHLKGPEKHTRLRLLPPPRPGQPARPQHAEGIASTILMAA